MLRDSSFWWNYYSAEHLSLSQFFVRLDDATKRLYKDLKKSMEAMATLSKHQCRIGHNLAASPVLNTEEELKSLELISTSVGQIEELTHKLVRT